MISHMSITALLERSDSTCTYLHFLSSCNRQQIVKGKTLMLRKRWISARLKCCPRCDVKTTLLPLKFKHDLIDLRALDFSHVYIRTSHFTSYKFFFSPGLACRMRQQTGVRCPLGQVSCLWWEFDYLSANQWKS